MGIEVYANGMSIACKAADGKSAAAMPDVCLSPPSPPAGPVPLPYPNTGMASDTDAGSKSVQINGQEVMLKDKSTFKTSTGDEAATKSLGMGVVTHQIQGKVSFVSWSMDVKVEGENVPRHLDLMIHNEASVPANTPTWPYIDKNARGVEKKCAKDKAKEKKACEGQKDPCAAAGAMKKPSRLKTSKTAPSMATRTAANKCLAARRCSLQPYKPNGCCPGQTPHHLVEASAFHEVGRGKPLKGGRPSVPLKGVKGYNEDKAPCVCAEGPTQNVGTHGLMHTFQSAAASACSTGELLTANNKKLNVPKTTYKDAKENGVKAMKKTFPESQCSEACIKAQLDAYHKQCGISNKTEIKAVETGDSSKAAVQAAKDEIKERTLTIKAARTTISAAGL